MTTPTPGGSGIPLVQPWQGAAAALVAEHAGGSSTWWLRGSRMRTRQGLLDEWSAAAQFPPHFGDTWDALRDALADLPSGGTFLVLEADQLLRDGGAADGPTLVAVLKAVAADLAPRPFRLVLQAEPRRFQALTSSLESWGVGRR